MQKDEPTFESNPAKALAARLIVGCIGGVLLFASLPTPLDTSNWWEHTAHLLFIAGAIALAFAIFAPKGWCDSLVMFIP
jgi:hypothetical protein